MFQISALYIIHNGINILAHFQKIINLWQIHMVKTLQDVHFHPDLFSADTAGIQEFYYYILLQTHMICFVDHSGSAFSNIFNDLISPV